MALLPPDPLALIGFGAVAGTVAFLLFSDWPRAYVLGVSSILIYAVQILGQMFGYGPLGMESLALSTDRLLAGGWWTPVTYAFLHAGLFHIFGNLFILLTAGPALEESVGPNWFLAIYAIGGLAAAGAGILLSLFTGIVATGTNMVGASGAIFGVLTAFAVRHPREKLPIILIFLVVWLPSMTVLLIYLAMNIAYIFTDTSIAWYGHFAGFLAGLALASLPALSRPGDGQGETGLQVEALEHLAQGREAREALAHLQEIEPGQEAVAEAWLDVLADEASCTACGSQLRRKGLRLVCQQGHDQARVPGRER